MNAYDSTQHPNKLTVRDLYDILGYLDVVKATTDKAIRESQEGGAYYNAMTRQAQKVRELIAKIESIEL